jgi:hypothetical protein
MKKLLILSIILSFSLCLFAQDEDISQANNEFGAHAGFTTGLGFSYRHWFDRFGFQVTGIPVKTNDYFFASIGATGLYSLKTTQYIRAFLYLGNHFVYQAETYESYDPYMGYSYGEEYTSYTRQYNIGFGPGFSVGRLIEFNLMVGYGIYDVGGDFNMLPAIEVGVYYNF